MIGGLCKLPVNFLFTTFMLWWLFGVSFFISLIPFAASFMINKYLAKRRKAMHKERMSLGDAKSNEINEILTNAKMLKLYGWTDQFKQRIMDSRENEKSSLRRIMIHDSIKQAVNHMLPNLIPAVCFATFIGRGGTLDLGTAVLSLTYFGKLSWTQNWFPNFLTNYHEMLISFDRIEEFLNTANV
jgi:ABC-type multidrug transport system fused ATPase/permease subunit